jgi:hypothetical protein
VSDFPDRACQLCKKYYSDEGLHRSFRICKNRHSVCLQCMQKCKLHDNCPLCNEPLNRKGKMVCNELLQPLPQGSEKHSEQGETISVDM